MTRTIFRADHIGSMLRPAALQSARAQRATGAISADELRSIEDDAIRSMVTRIESAGVQAVTDGDFRRTWFHIDFLEQFEGTHVSANPNAQRDRTPPIVLKVVGPLRHTHPVQAADYKFLASCTQHTGKVCIPSPSMVHFFGGRAAVDATAYPDMDLFWDDLAAAYRAELQSLYAAGCRYVQLDDTTLAYLCDPAHREAATRRGDDPAELPHTYVRVINEAVRGLPDDMQIGIHLCRGNFRGTHFGEGGYEPVAEVLFNDLDVDTYLLEYDDERSGDFAPLRHVPPGKTVVLGLVTTKRPDLERVDDLLARIDEASGYLALDQLALSPQCGFSCNAEGAPLSEDDQWAKLDVIVETARRVWG